MFTKSRARVSRVHRKRSLSIENLESRLNLSTLVTAASRLLPLTRPVALQTATYNNVNLIPVTSNATTALKATNPATDPFNSSRFGDTWINNTGTSSVDVTSYTALSGARVEWVGGAPDIGYMAGSGASISYRLNIAAAGTYALNFGVATPNGFGSFDLNVNGAKQVGYSFGSTGAWNKYTGVSQNVSLSAGANTITLLSTWGSKFNINSIKLTPVSLASPVTTPTPAPAPIVASSSAIPVSSWTSITADKYSAISNSRLEWVNGKPDIGYVSPSGSYVEYSLNVQKAGNYNLSLSTAAINPASLSISTNGSKAATANIASTGGWATYGTSAASVYLPAGAVTLRFSSLNATQYNLGNIVLSQAASATTPASTTAATSIASSGGTIQANGYSRISNSKLDWANGKPYIGYVSTSGAYVEYTLKVQSAGNYNLALSTAAVSPAALTASVNGTPASTVNIASTGSWLTFGTSNTTAYLPAGSVTLRFASLWGTQYNLGNISLTPAVAATPAPAPIPVPTPASTGAAITVSTQYMTSFNQLNIVGTSGNDSIYVRQSGNTLTVVANGKTSSYNGPFGDIVIKSGGGNDNITVDSSVWIDTLVYGGAGNDSIRNATQGKATIVTIGGGYDTVQGNGWNSSIWADSSDAVNATPTEINAGQVHLVSGFWGGVSTQLSGQNLQDPGGTGSTTRLSNSSLWGTGPSMADVVQGQAADCYFLGALQSLAKGKANQLREVAVDLGDGTFAVQFKRGGTTTYVRVDADLPAGGPYASGLNYAHPGASGNQWLPILEKAYAEFRSGAWSYGSLNDGYFGGVLADLGFSYSSFGAVDPNTLYNNISNAVASGKGVTVGTNSWVSAGAPLIAYHTYTVTAAWKDAWGTGYVTLRNPWGFDGAGGDSNPGDGLVTMTISQLQQNLQAGAILM